MNYYPKYEGDSKSITTALQAVGEKDTSAIRKRAIAVANGIYNYTGTRSQNNVLLDLLKRGILVRPN